VIRLGHGCIGDFATQDFGKYVLIVVDVGHGTFLKLVLGALLGLVLEKIID
jgi:hypothetical protein